MTEALAAGATVVAVLSRGLRPRTPSTAGSLALAQPTGDDAT